MRDKTYCDKITLSLCEGHAIAMGIQSHEFSLL